MAGLIIVHVVDNEIANDAHHAGVRVDLDFADMRTVGEREIRRRPRAPLEQPRLQARRDFPGLVSRLGNLIERQPPVGAVDREISSFEHNVGRRRFHQVRGDLPAFVDHLVRRNQPR
jgi:hypothetical protein